MEAAKLKGEDGYVDGSYVKFFVVLNGLHRRDALLHQCRDLFHQAPSQKRNAAARDFGMVRVEVLRWKDGKTLSENEVTASGGLANENTSKRRRPTFSDQLHFRVSFLQEFFFKILSKYVRPGKMVFQIHAVKMMPSLFEKTLTKYARTAITFVRRPAFYKKDYRMSRSDVKGEQLQPAPVQCANFHNVFTEEEQLTLLDCLRGCQQQASL